MVFDVSRPLRAKLRWVLILLAWGFLGRDFLPIPSSTYVQRSRWPAGNETLGFGAIFALTIDDSTWRVQGLRAAAKLAGLQIRIPVQKRPSDEDAYAYLAGNEPTEVLNEVKATLNYLSRTEMFLKTGYETALFLEDDADFSIDIRSQMEAISSAMLGDSAAHDTANLHNGEELNRISRFPYGENDWDVSWIGHIGVEFSPVTKVTHYTDAIALPWDRLTSDFNNYYETVRATRQKDQEIVTHVAPMATYGFALTRSTAQMLVCRLRDDRSQKFDLALHILCKGRELRCSSPVPEVVHHHSVLGMETIRLAGEGKGEKEDISWWRKRH